MDSLFLLYRRFYYTRKFCLFLINRRATVFIDDCLGYSNNWFFCETGAKAVRQL